MAENPGGLGAEPGLQFNPEGKILGRDEIMKKIRLYLLDENGNSPCFGVDETVEVETVEEAKTDFANYLVANEGFEFADTPGHVRRDGKEYRIEAE